MDTANDIVIVNMPEVDVPAATREALDRIEHAAKWLADMKSPSQYGNTLALDEMRKAFGRLAELGADCFGDLEAIFGLAVDGEL